MERCRPFFGVSRRPADSFESEDGTVTYVGVCPPVKGGIIGRFFDNVFAKNVLQYVCCSMAVNVFVEHVCSTAVNVFFVCVVDNVVGVLNNIIIIIVPANHTCGQMSLQPLPFIVPLKRDIVPCRYITTCGLVMFGLDSLCLQLPGYD